MMKPKFKKALLIIFITIVAIAVTLGAAFLIVSKYYYNKMNYESLPEDSGGNMQIPQEELESILAEIEKQEKNEDFYDSDWDTLEPETIAPETSASDVTEPDTSSPDVTEPDTSSPETTVPVTTPPETTAPETTAPETTAPETAPSTPVPPKFTSDGDKVRHILLIGSDYIGERGLSDIMVVASINETEKTITCTSLMRDTYVYIPVNQGITKKLNTAHQIGGIALLKKTIEKNFGIKIDNYMRVGFEEAVALFDHLGGLAVKLDEAEVRYIKQSVPSSTITYDPAKADSKGFVTLHLNGEELRAHARNRSTGGRVDFNRTRRQREILEAAFEKSKTMSITEMMSFLGDALPLITTDISYSDFVGYISDASEYTSYEFESFRIPSDGCWKYWKNYVLITNTEKTMKQWFNMVYN